MSLPILDKVSKYSVPEIPGKAEADAAVAEAKQALINARNPLPFAHNPTPGATIQKSLAQIKQEAMDEAEYESSQIHQPVDTGPDDTDVEDHPTYAKIVDFYQGNCKRVIESFFTVLATVIKALIKVYQLLNSLQKEIDLELQKLPDFPSLPSGPGLPRFDIDTIDTDELKCPLAECLGLPSPPTIRFPVGISMEEALAPVIVLVPDPENPGEFIEEEQESPYTEEQYMEWDEAGKEYLGRLQEASGASASAVLNNAKEILKNTPQGILNGIVDATKAVIGGFVSVVILDKVDGQLACMEGKDPRIGKVYEVLLYKKLRQHIAFDQNNSPIIKLQGTAQDVLGEIQGKLADIDDLQKKAEGFMSQASGAVDLPDPNPSSVVSSLRNKFL